ncbi:MAG: arsenate reductase (glutaredoxin) [Woeseiaceae bacterium]|nr:arsenate reductase (glutaredoxin) [Woeseiaceae bacterium]
MTVTIYHNPRCSKSRQSLKLLSDAGAEPTIVEYLKQPPSPVQIKTLADRLGVRVADILRTGEAEYKEATDLPALDDDAALADWVAVHPKVLQRPIVVNETTGAAVVGRPPETVLQILDR